MRLRCALTDQYASKIGKINKVHALRKVWIQKNEVVPPNKKDGLRRLFLSFTATKVAVTLTGSSTYQTQPGE